MITDDKNDFIHPDSRDDQSVWRRFIAGDVKAYEVIYKEHIQTLFSYGMTITDDVELVKDCIQDVFVKIYHNRQSLHQTNNIRLYLITALKNTLFNAFRKQNSYRAIIKSVETEEIDNDIAIEKLISQEKKTEQEKLVAICKSLLTQRQQEIIHYKFVEELTLEEISERLDINYHSVANIIQRAFRKIRLSYRRND